MKKKLMMVAVLLGALTLGACVDDNESASVTKVREAKAAQLNAAAALNNAQAEAAIIAANAEAEVKKAEAAYQQALADAANAATAEKEMLIEQAKQKFAEELAMLKEKYAAKIAKYRVDKQMYDNQLWNKAESHIQAVYNAYTGALYKVNTFTESKLEAQVEKSKTEALVITAEESLKQTLANLNIEKAQNERELAKWTAMKEKQPSKDDYLAKLDELEKQAYDIVQNKLPGANAAKKSAGKAYNDAKDAFEDGEYKFVVAAEELNLLSDEARTSSFAEASFVSIAEDAVNNYDGGNLEGSFRMICYSLPLESQIQRATIDVDDYFSDKLENADIAIKDAEGKEWEKDADGNIIYGDPNSVKGAESELAYRNQQIASQKKAIAVKEKEIADAEKEATPDKDYIQQLKDELEGMNTALTDLEDTRNLAQAITHQNEVLAEKKADKVDIEEAQKAYKANLAILRDATALKAYEDAFKALEPLAITYIEKQAEVAPIIEALNEMGFDESGDKTNSGEYADVKSLLDGITDVQEYINSCNTRLAEIESQVKLGDLNNLVSLQQVTIRVYDPIIKDYKYIDVYSYVLNGSGRITLADAIAILDAQIKLLDEKISIQQDMADKYKVELDALLAAE